MFGNYIYDKGSREIDFETGKEENQLKNLFERHMTGVEMERTILNDFAFGKKLSLKRLWTSKSPESRSPEADSENEEK